MTDAASHETTNRSESIVLTTKRDTRLGACSDDDCRKPRPVAVSRDDVADSASTIRDLKQEQCLISATPQQSLRPCLLPSLQVRTDVIGNHLIEAEKDPGALHHSLSSANLIRRTPSFRAIMASAASSAGSPSPSSIISSPRIAALGDITPLPSPMSNLPPWKRQDWQNLSRPSSRNSSNFSLRLSDSSQMLSPSASRSRIKQYPGLDKLGEEIQEICSKSPSQSHPNPIRERDRSLSEYLPPSQTAHVHPRQIAVSGTGLREGFESSDSTDSKTIIHREQHLALQRGIKVSTAHPLTSSKISRNDHERSDFEPLSLSDQPASPDDADEIYSVRSIRTQNPRKYRKLRELGHGTFSQVCLAVRLEDPDGSQTESDRDSFIVNGMAGPPRRLVAVKIIEYGPTGGADEERLEVSLKREVDILKSVNHPSLIQLKAFGNDEKRALLVLDFCSGGDLFEFVSSGLKPLIPPLIRRIFAELVDAVRYLHRHFIVHRDIKLENVLVNLPAPAMEQVNDWRTYGRAVVTLSDLGLSRRIPEPPESPLLETRCGSEDYAAPEILMGQPYDGRSTDAWALGVLLYAMMENRLPFDPLPGSRGDPAKLRARTGHRIARLEWAWYRYANSEGDWDTLKGQELEGSRGCVEGLLKRSTRRKSLDEIADLDWVQNAIDVPGGLERGDKEVP